MCGPRVSRPLPQGSDDDVEKLAIHFMQKNQRLACETSRRDRAACEKPRKNSGARALCTNLRGRLDMRGRMRPGEGVSGARRPRASQSVRRQPAMLHRVARALSTPPVDKGVHDGVGEAFHAPRGKGCRNNGERIARHGASEINDLNVEPSGWRRGLPARPQACAPARRCAQSPVRTVRAIPEWCDGGRPADRPDRRRGALASQSCRARHEGGASTGSQKDLPIIHKACG